MRKQICKGDIFIKTLTVNSNDANQRLDKFLTKTFENLPPAMLYKFIRTKKIKVNRKRTEAGYKLRDGDIVELYVKDEFLINSDAAQNFRNIIPNIKIIYEDENILLADKKPGVIVHPDSGEEINTLINHITAYLYKNGDYDPDAENSFAPALCNRIDRNTGGIVICAKNAESLRIINEKIKLGEIEKLYLCLVHGTLPEKQGLLTAYHRKDEINNLVTISKNKFPGSKIIRTQYKVIKVTEATEVTGERPDKKISLLEVKLITGRTHQIRAHMAYMGCPLVGDGKYGDGEQIKADRKKGFHYQALYSYSVKFDFANNTEAGRLKYLAGKKFSVKLEDIKFLL